MTSSEKRQRHKEGHRSRVEEARLAQARADRRRRAIVLGVIAALVIVLAVGVRLLQDDDGEDTTTSASTTAPLDTSTSDTAAPAPTIALPEPPTGRTIEGATPCPVGDTGERVAQFSQAPPTCIEPGEPLEAVVETTAGSFTIALDTEAAPVAANNFVVLARYGYFDGLPFHRLLPNEYAQTGSSGDPTWGTGGPGYDLEGGELPEGPYAAGDVAMAKGTAVSGGQWFAVVSGEAAANLDLQPDYPRFGRITEGLDLVVEMSTKGDPAQASDGSDGNPTELITITSVTVQAP